MSALAEPVSLRIGWPAVALDGICAVAGLAAAYWLRFSTSDALHYLNAAAAVLVVIVALQVLAGLALGLYRREGQAMWPIRLGVASLFAVAVGGFGAGWLGFDAGVSRQALGVHTALFWLFAMAWRAADGLRFRQARKRAYLEEFGDAGLVVQGEEFTAMSTGMARVVDYGHLLRNLVARDLKLKYRGSLLGFAWSMLNPLVMIGVYTVAFTFVMRLDTPRFVLYVLIGLLSWNFFATSVMTATDSIASNGSLLRSVIFPRIVLPFSAVFFTLTQFILSLAVFLPLLLLVYRVPLSPIMLLFPVFLILQVVFIAGLSLLLSTATAVFRDVRHLVEVAIGMLFWATPIVYEMKLVPEQFQFLALLSPAAPYIRAYQDLFYYGVMPDISIWLVSVAYAAGAFICGLSVFLAYEGHFSEMV
jgi:ABC-type polysaccharide/polyol phosphate export permease